MSHSTPRPRVALIGVTGYAGIYFNHLRELIARREIELVAAVIVNLSQATEIAAELRVAGTTIYESADEFFAKQSGRIDLCLIPVGIQWHARLTVAALHAGMNVLVEKPLAGSLEDALSIRRAETETGRWVAVGFQDIYSKDCAWMKAQLLGGVIGRVEEVRMIGLWPRPRSYFTRNHWAGRLRADGGAVCDSPLNNAFAHFVNLALFFAGETSSGSAVCHVGSAELFRAHAIETFDTAVVRGSSTGGVRFWFGVSHSTAEAHQPEIHLHGSKGRVTWLHADRCAISTPNSPEQIFRLSSEEENRRRMFQAVLDRLRNPNTSVCTTDIAEAHAHLISSVQAHGKVSEFLPEQIRWRPDAAGRPESPEVGGLYSRLQQSMMTGSPLELSEEQPSLVAAR